MTGMHSRFGLFNTEARILQSACVGEAYQIGIWFPFSYTSSHQTYPVLYVTDGDYTFSLATVLVPTLIGTQEIPEVIAVGIGYNQISNYDEFGKLRELDMLPPGFTQSHPDSRMPEFMAFLRQELFPLIEANYRASPDDRTLYGFSVGRFFARTWSAHKSLLAARLSPFRFVICFNSFRFTSVLKGFLCRDFH